MYICISIHLFVVIHLPGGDGHGAVDSTPPEPTQVRVFSQLRKDPEAKNMYIYRYLHIFTHIYMFTCRAAAETAPSIVQLSSSRRCASSPISDIIRRRTRYIYIHTYMSTHLYIDLYIVVYLPRSGRNCPVNSATPELP